LAGGDTGRGGCQVLLEGRDLFCEGVEVMVVGKQEAAGNQIFIVE
jgi:hypothetical protein